MAEKVTIELLDESGAPRSQFIDVESANALRKQAAVRAWKQGVLVGAAGASTAAMLAKWLSDRE